MEPEDEDKADDGPNEEMEITWEPGMSDDVIVISLLQARAMQG